MKDYLNNFDKVYNFIIDFIKNDIKKHTPSDITILLKKKFGIKRKEINNIIQTLVSDGELEYTNFFGRTYLEISFSKPVQVSENIILKPPVIKYLKKNNEIVINIEKGISFGRGSHPTTSLCLQAIDYILSKEKENLKNTTALDIGTGSGVLAVAGAMFGIKKVYGCDIDPVSINEAKKNIKINKLCKKISITNNFDDLIKYEFIFANLRYPTLIDLQDTIKNITKENSAIILSGIKIEEKEKIEKIYNSKNYKKIWENEEKGWVAYIFNRK